VTCVAVNQQILYTGSWDKTIKVWRTEASLSRCLADLDSRMSIYSGRTYWLCQISIICIISRIPSFRFYRCIITRVEAERFGWTISTAYPKRTFSCDWRHCDRLVSIFKRGDIRIHSKFRPDDTKVEDHRDRGFRRWRGADYSWDERLRN